MLAIINFRNLSYYFYIYYNFFRNPYPWFVYAIQILVTNSF